MINLKAFKETGTLTITKKELEKAKKAGVKVFLNHGDVMLQAVDTKLKTTDMKVDKDNLLALGEFSGHAHKAFESEEAKAKLYYNPDSSDKVFIVKGSGTVTIKHPEHKPLKVPDGTYKVGVQKEYNPWTRKLEEVAD